MIFTGLIAGLTLGTCTAARWYLDRSSRRESAFWGGRIRLTALRNGGSAFGLLRLGRWPLAALSAAVLAGGLPLYRKRPVSGGLLLGGGLSNLWERLRHGSVYDYVELPGAPRPAGRYVFNLADFAIMLGTGGLFLGKCRIRKSAFSLRKDT